ncbi:hypothetical protein [Streptomyces sp. JJ38]|uniref:hypothetical protein n=1 Tax=Streptomyces sp. JJ38 TaxID=2738128 RepID=UPI001C5A02D6|nr:hypothetical protein [Streptomyces sp. JJ38]MBW1599321.1 hypothetical protein [Streptomyces sp. JJ38]
MDRRKATAGVLAAIVLTAVAGTGCSGRTVAVQESTGDDPRAQMRRVADELAEARTSRVRSRMELRSGGTRLTIRGAGGFDFRRRMGRIEVTLPDERQDPVTAVIAPGALYMKNRGAGVPEDKWVRVDPAELPDGNLVSNGVTDPLVAVELLRGVSSVRYVGTRRLDGKLVRRFRGTTDVRAAAGEASQGRRDQLSAAAKGFSTRAVPFEAHLDEEGRLRRVRHTFVFGNDEAVVSTTELYAFGTSVEVELPPRADVYTGRIATTTPAPPA